MLNLAVHEAAPGVAKVVVTAVAKVAEKAVTEYPPATLALAAAWLFGYQTGRADAYGEFLNMKRISA